MNTDRNLEPPEPLTIAQQLEIDRICAEFESVWQAAPNTPPDLRAWVSRLPTPLARPLFCELLAIDGEYRQKHGLTIAPEILQEQFPAYTKEIAKVCCDGKSSLPASPDEHSFSQHLAAQQTSELQNYIRQLEQTPLHDLPQSIADWTAHQLELARNLDKTLAQTTSSPPTVNTGRLERLGDFRIIREIGRGGMGTVFEAEQLSLRRRVALKVLWFGAAYDAESVQRFEREATTIANLHHTNIVPIFAVGKQDNINYYAMQLIEGQSLDRLVKQSSFACDAARVTDWGVQAAEALAHAHERGVIHRDIKPSNLMLDQSGRLWLTDFGLAKSDQDQSLSLAGVMLGTPRYMSPEQAATNLSRVDHRSDIYSLGATLFEMLAGRPVFEGDSPIVLIQQILSEEPPPLDRLRPEISRDLATVIMKCLQKDPRERYATARDLLHDLRCVSEGRPIRARRTSPVELASKWLKRHQTSLRTTAVVLIATALIVFGLGLTWFTVQQYYTTRLSLTSGPTPITVEFYNQQQQLVHPPVTLPTHRPLEFDSQSLLLRATSDGMPSVDYRWEANPQTHETWKLDLLDQNALFPETERLDFRFFKTPQHNLIVSWSSDRLFIDVSGSMTQSPDVQTEQQALPLAQIAQAKQVNQVALLGSDLDGDGVEEIVLSFARQSAIHVVSRRSGKLWQQNFEWIEPQRASEDNAQVTTLTRGDVLQPPQLVPDQDGDGKQDLLVVIGQNPFDPPSDGTRATRSLCLVSATGTLLWRTNFAEEQFKLPPGATVAPSMQWHLADPYSSGSHSIGSFFVRNGRRLRHLERSQMLEAPHIEAPQAAWLQMQGQDRVLVRTGTKLHLLKLINGENAVEPLETDMASSAPFQLHDLDGDQVDEVILIERLDPLPNSNPSGFVDSIPQSRLAVWSIGKRQKLWEKTVAARSPQPNLHVARPRWPIVAAGADRWMVIPQQTNRDVGYTGQSLPWSEIDFVNAANGQVRWTQRIPNVDSWTDQVTSIPDMDHDAIPEVIIASFWSMPWELVVECRAGNDGKLLWITRYPIDEQQLDEIESVQYLPEAHRIQATLSRPEHPRTAIQLDADSGQIRQTIPGFKRLELLDFDGDQVDDWCVVRSTSDQNGSKQKLHVVAGRSNERWRRLGKPLQIGSDFDLDGYPDLLAVSEDRVSAISTVHGGTLWTLESSQRWSECRAYTWQSMLQEDRWTGNAPQTLAVAPRQTWDIDLDGTLDVILQTVNVQALAHPAITAISGRTGEILWQSQPTRFQRANLPRLTIGDLDGNGRLDILSCEPRPIKNLEGIGQTSNSTVQSRLAFSMVRWELGTPAAIWIHDIGQSLGESNFLSWDQAYDLSKFPKFRFANADKDRVADCLVVQEQTGVTDSSSQLVVAAVSGTTGNTLWSIPIGVFAISDQTLNACDRLVTADLDQDGNNELLWLSFETRTKADGNSERIASLKAYDCNQGSLRWNFETEVAEGFLTSGSNSLVRPFPVQAGENRIVIALNLRNRDQRDVVVVVDANGKAYGEYSMARRQSFYHDGFQCWIFDCDGDGNQEILFDDTSLVALKIDPKLAVWQTFPISVAENDVDLQVIEVTPTKRQIVVLKSGNYRATAFDATSAQPQWQVTGPQSNRQYHADRAPIQIVGSEWAIENLMPNSKWWVVCNGFLDCTTVTESRFQVDESPTFAKEPVRTSAASPSQTVTDYRWERPLPWSSRNIEKNLLSGPGELTTFIGFVLLSSGLVVWLPWAIWRAMRWRWISHLGAMLLLSLCAAVDGAFLGQSFSVPFLFERPDWHAKLTLALQYAPLWLILFCIPLWIWRGSWRSLGAWLIVVLLSSALIGAVEIAADLQAAPLTTGEYYGFSWSPLIIGYGLFATSWLGVAVWGSRSVLSGITHWLEHRLGASSKVVGWLRGWQPARAVTPGEKGARVSPRYVRTIYLWASLGWTTWLIICPNWQGVHYWLDSVPSGQSPQIGGSFALNEPEPQFVWDPPLAAGLSDVTIRWPGQSIRNYDHIEIDIQQTLFRFLPGMFVIGSALMIVGSVSARERKDPAWLQVAAMTLLLGMVWFTSIVLRALSQGELPGSTGMIFLVMSGLVLGYGLGRWTVAQPRPENRKVTQ